MEAIPPKAQVPEHWMHPALHRQLLRREKLRDTRDHRLDELDAQCVEMGKLSGKLDQSLTAARRALDDLDRKRQRIKAAIERDEKTKEIVHSVHEHLTNQIIMHKTLPRNLPQSCTVTAEVEGSRANHCTISVVCGTMWGTVGPCFPCDDKTKSVFFSKYAPLFAATPSKESMRLRVEDALFFDEVCLLSGEQGNCGSPACPYWHKEQLAHVKLGAHKLLTHASGFVSGNSNNCDVAAMLEKFQTAIVGATGLAETLRIEGNALNCIADLGLAAAFLHGESEEEKDRKDFYAASPCIAWDAPLLQKPQLSSAQQFLPLLRLPQERAVWEELTGTPPSQLIEAALGLFHKRSDELSWRCLMRVAGDTPERLMWLASRGVELFPTSPGIRLALISALVRSGCAPSDCVDTCIESTQILSTQAAKCALSTAESIIWSESAARYIAYMMAITCVHASSTDPQSAVRLLSVVVNAPGQICLLPLAQQNFTLLYIVTQQFGRLDGLSSLPLASISDVAFTLSEHFPYRLKENCAELLSRQLSMNTGCAAAGINAELVGYMQAAIHLSLLRIFSEDARLVEQILTKSTSYPVTAMGEVWCEYLRFVNQRDNKQCTIPLIQSLFGQCDAPLLTLHFVRCLEFHGEETSEAVRGFVQRFAQKHSIPLENLGTLAAGEAPSLPADEWVPFILLYARHLPPRYRVELILSVPTVLYSEVPELVFVLWFEVISAAVMLRDDSTFRRCTAFGLLLLREPFLHHFSPIDCEFEDMVALPHTASLVLYRAVPVLLGTQHHMTSHYRKIVLEVSAELHVMHPFLCMK
uniref:Uncharacterized protein TCIL3000_5_1340 n=1 Tax=Trypanosoma congolense (strain IL3000) TaxID=1068625 RepID=G0UMM5_TRYCI|nr:unnamed protein product [Trypanosoma congolense IL3000]